MADYNALKVPDLKKLLQTRSLPVSGNKAELVARLVEYEKNEQSKSGSDAAGVAITTRATGDAAAAKDVTKVDQQTATDANKMPAGIAPPADDEIDWGDEEPTVPMTTTTTTTAPGTSTTKDQRPRTTTTTTNTQGATEPVAAAAGGDLDTTAASTNDVGSASNPKTPAVINAKADFDPSQTHDLTVKYPDATQKTSNTTTNATTNTTTTTTEKPAQNDDTKNFAAGLNSTDLDAEIARRKARALRFQTSATPTTTTDAPTDDDVDDTARQGQEAIKALERAKRFGPVKNGLSDDNVAVDGALNGGGGAVGVKGLDQALPDGRPSRKRGRGAGHDDIDSNHRWNMNAKRRRGDPVGRDVDHYHVQIGRNSRPIRSGGGGNQGERNGRSIGGSGGGNQNGKGKRSGGRITDDPVEKAKAEARAKKFAAPPPPTSSKVTTTS